MISHGSLFSLHRASPGAPLLVLRRRGQRPSGAHFDIYAAHLPRRLQKSKSDFNGVVMVRTRVVDGLVGRSSDSGVRGIRNMEAYG